MTGYLEHTAGSAALFEQARQVMPGGNTRTTVASRPYPLYCAKGYGTFVEDVDGNRYIDFIGNHSVLIHGHCFPPIVDAISEQSRTLIAAGMPTEGEMRLAELLTARVPSLQRIRFCSSGSEAVMFAVRAARAFTGRSKIAKIEGAYHGSYDSVDPSISPDSDDWGRVERPNTVTTSRGITNSVLHDTVVLPMNDVQNTLSIIESERSDLAAIIVDPVIPRLGYARPDSIYLNRLADMAHSVGALVIVDEVYSFRVDYHGAQSQYRFTPDLTALGKIIGGGLPIGAFGGRADIMDLFASPHERPALPHGGTFNGNPMTMAAGIVSMSELGHQEFERLAKLGTLLAEELTLLSSDSLPIQVTQSASLLSITFAEQPVTTYRERASALPFHRRVMRKLYPELLRAGILMTPNGQMTLNTVMTEEHITRTLDVLQHALRVARSAVAA